MYSLDTKLSGRAFVISLVVLIVTGLYAASAPAQAQSNHYGALAYNERTGAWGSAYNYGSRSDAERSALSRCGSGCRVAVWFRNGCGALSDIRYRNGAYSYASAWSGNLDGAVNRSLAQCNGRCGVVAWACTAR